MVFDVTRHQPAEPALNDALQQALCEMETALASVNEGTPAQRAQLCAFLKDVGGGIHEDMCTAPSLESQRDMMMGAMHTILHECLVGGMHRDQFALLMNTMETSMRRLGEKPISRSAGLARQQIQRYGQVICESYDFAIAMGEHWQRDHEMKQGNATPFELAKAAGAKDDEEIRTQAGEILNSYLAPFQGTMPYYIGPDSLGLIARAVKRIDGRSCANDRTLAEQLGTKATIDRTRHVLSDVFRKHTDVESSPSQVVDASRSLDNALLR